MWGWKLLTCTLALSLDSWDRTVGWTGQQALWVKEGYGPHHDLAGRRDLQPQAKDTGQDPPGKGREVTLGSFSVILGCLYLCSSQAALRALGKENAGPSAAVPSILGALGVPEATVAGFCAYLFGGWIKGEVL